MPIIQLLHDKRLGYSSAKQLPAIPKAILAMAKDRTMITFRPLKEGQPAETRRGIHACTRFLDLPKGDLIFLNVETDSPLAPLVLWDAVHASCVDCTITLVGETSQESFLEQAYFNGSLKVMSRDKESITFRKVAPLRAEQDRGLDHWTFGIPVGPEDATLLNVTIKRILELDIPNKEILLCGRPGANFKYWDQVRIVGEDIPAPPVRICTKKNRLVDEAKYGNLCILHDRVFLPLNFMDAVSKFGDLYPLTALQSLFFDDYNNLIARRYSDYNKATDNLTNGVTGLSKNSLVSSSFSPSVFSELETSGFVYGNPLRDPINSYPTGSLYIVKKSVWQFCPQDENLYWTEFEDVELGIRAGSVGIPSRVNPYAFTQSLSGRPLLSFGGAVTYENIDGRKQVYKSPFEMFPIRRKPLVKISHQEAEKKARLFIKKYNSRTSFTLQASEASTLSNSEQRCALIAKLIYGASFVIKESTVKEFIDDVEKNLLLDQIPYHQKQYILRNIVMYGRGALHLLVENNSELINQVSQRPNDSMFYEDSIELLPRRGVANLLGSLISAFYLARRNGKIFFSQKGTMAYFRIIRSSTPFRDYAEEQT